MELGGEQRGVLGSAVLPPLVGGAVRFNRGGHNF